MTLFSMIQIRHSLFLTSNPPKSIQIQISIPIQDRIAEYTTNQPEQPHYRNEIEKNYIKENKRIKLLEDEKDSEQEKLIRKKMY